MRHVRAVRDLRGRARAIYLTRLGARWLGRAAAPPRVERPRSILFVCHGNIMRSAVAEAMLKERLGPSADVRVMSAGTWPIVGRAADERMQAAAARFGLSLDTHRASALTRELVDAAELIVVMDGRNEADVLARFPDAAPRLALLGQIAAHAGGAEIPDPYTQDEDAVQRCASVIDACIAALARTLATAA
jgi:protein-tyrosine-phosphatase